MKASVAQKIKIGIFTIAGIVLFVIGIFLIGSKKNMFGNTFLIYGTFSNVSGLEPGSNIRFGGINVGTVEGVRIISDSLIRVDMRMKDHVSPFLKTDAIATIGSDGLMGDKLITITSGSKEQVQLLTPGSRILTEDPVDFDKVIGQFTNVATNAEIITGELAAMAVQIRKGDGTISKLLYTDDLSRSLEGTASNAERVTNSLAGIASQINSGKGSVGRLIYTDSLSNYLEEAATTANASMRSINTAAKTADESMVSIQAAANSFNENMEAIQNSFLFRGYFRRKEKQEVRAEHKTTTTTTTTPSPDMISKDMDEAELKAIITEAQKALKEKKK